MHPEASGIPLAAQAAPRLSAPSARPTLLGAGAGALLFAATFLAIPGIVNLRGAGPETVALLAATPLRGDDARKEYRAGLTAALLDRKLEPALLDRLVEADVADGRCEDAVSVLLEHCQRARAAELGERCGAPGAAARAAFEMGDFQRAARLLEKVDPSRQTRADLQFAARVHLLAGHLEAAAAAARRLVEDAPSDDLGGANESRALACFADALDARRGDQAALARLRVRSTPACEVLAGELQEGWERFDRLQYASHEYRAPHSVMQRLGALLIAPRDHGQTNVEHVAAEDILLNPIHGPPLWGVQRAMLESLAHEPPPSGRLRWLRGSLAASMAELDAASGHAEEALGFAERAADDYDAHCAEPEHESCNWGLATDDARDRPGARAPAPSTRFPLASLARGGCSGSGQGPQYDLVPCALLALQGRREVDKGVFEQASPESDTVGGLAWHLSESFAGGDLAANGMSIPLVRDLWSTRRAPQQALRLIGLTNRSAAGRDELRFWLRWGAVTRCYGCEVTATFADAAARLTLAEALGDVALAAELRPIVESFRRVLLRAETAVPLAVLESLWPPSPGGVRTR